MNFYGIEYLKSQSNLNDYLKYFFIFALLIGLVIVFSFYVRHQIQTKYRELSIIIFFIIIICFRGSIFQLSTEPKSAFTIFTNGTFCRTSGTGKKKFLQKKFMSMVHNWLTEP